MAKKKRRRPAAPSRTSRRTAAAPPPAVVVAEPSPAPRVARTARRPLLDDPGWSRLALLTLVAMAFAAQMVVGLVTHLIGHRQRLLLGDLFFFQAPFVLAACVLLMPLAKIVTHQPRMLRLLEALSLGAVFALFALLLTSLFVHPAQASASLTTDQLIDKLGTNDALGILLADVLAMLVSVQLFPGLQRILTAPGRRARERLLARRAAEGPSRGAKSTPRARR